MKRAIALTFTILFDAATFALTPAMWNSDNHLALPTLTLMYAAVFISYMYWQIESMAK